MNDLDTLRPEVREAVHAINHGNGVFVDSDDSIGAEKWRIVLAELLRLADECDELRTAYTSASQSRNHWRERVGRAEAELAALRGTTTVSTEMIHEAEAHVPGELRGPDRWEWLAKYLNRALKHPGVPCPCCGVAPNGEIYDHLTPEQWQAMQPKEES